MRHVPKSFRWQWNVHVSEIRASSFLCSLIRFGVARFPGWRRRHRRPRFHVVLTGDRIGNLHLAEHGREYTVGQVELHRVLFVRHGGRSGWVVSPAKQVRRRTPRPPAQMKYEGPPGDGRCQAPASNAGRAEDRNPGRDAFSVDRKPIAQPPVSEIAARNAPVPVVRKKRKRRKKFKRDPNAPKRPLGAYLLFCQDNRGQVVEANPKASFGDVGRLLGKMWQEAGDDQRMTYQAADAEHRARYEREFNDIGRLASSAPDWLSDPPAIRP
ncbi:hypothetical protein PBRA_003098 [Plasmodiophora brassicae]|uniref:HMG box domain-containing protein n=1 Tax=Plasmodiophora brassicae TaxID=37360 RepID=A0A0G4J7K1_PLABS|nr:hypothetical protein PBRA_003098 [Plasmodiophora brassicae]